MGWWVRLGAGMAVGLACVGCSDPVVGKWASEQSFACGVAEQKITLDIGDDHTGTGTFCDCKFTLLADDRGDDTYRMNLEYADTCVLDNTKRDCEMKREGERLDCGDFEDNGLGVYEKVGE